MARRHALNEATRRLGHVEDTCQKVSGAATYTFLATKFMLNYSSRPYGRFEFAVKEIIRHIAKLSSYSHV